MAVSVLRDARRRELEAKRAADIVSDGVDGVVNLVEVCGYEGLGKLLDGAFPVYICALLPGPSLERE